MKIYISGKITGDDNYKQKFINVEKALTKKYPGSEIINPSKLGDIISSASWTTYMKICIELLGECDTLYMLDDYTDSKGSGIEYTIALSENKRIIYQSCEECWESGCESCRDFRNYKKVERIGG